MTHGRRCVSLLLGMLWWASGCEPLDRLEGNYYRKQAAQTAPKTYRKAPEAVKEEAVATALAREAPAPDGQGAMNDWVARELKKLPGDVLFPQWKTRRAGLSRYEVQFLFTLVDSTKVMRHKGFAWDVDVNLKIVSPPRELVDRNLAAPERKP